jgi:hypothetical protein
MDGLDSLLFVECILDRSRSALIRDACGRVAEIAMSVLATHDGKLCARKTGQFLLTRPS